MEKSQSNIETISFFHGMSGPGYTTLNMTIFLVQYYLNLFSNSSKVKMLEINFPEGE